MIHDLFKFIRGDNLEDWTYTSSDIDIDYNSETYISTPIGSTDRESKNQLSKEQVQIKVPLTSVMVNSWLAYENDEVINVSIYEMDTEDDTHLVWSGRLVAKKPNDKEYVLHFESLYTTLKQNSFSEKYQRTCNRVHYQRGCNLNKEDFEVIGTVLSVDGRNVVIDVGSLSPDGEYTLGIIEAADGYTRFIESHTGDNFVLTRPLSGLTVSSSVKLYPGCDRSKERCKDRFDNILNNGSCPFIPIVDPYGGTSIV